MAGQPPTLRYALTPQLPKGLVKFVPKGVLAEDVWRGLGIRQSPGWEMYMRHEPVRHPTSPLTAGTSRPPLPEAKGL